MERPSGEEMMAMAGRVYHEYYKAEKALEQDLVSEGVVGILVGLDKFDEAKGVQLSTFMCACARNAMASYMRRERKRKAGHGLVALEVVEVEDVLDMDGMAERQRLAEAMMKVREASGVLRPRANAIANELLKGRRQIDVAREFGVSRQDVNNVFKKIKRRITEQYEYCEGQLERKVVRTDE